MRKRFVSFFKESIFIVLILVLKDDILHLGKNMKNKGSDEECFSDC